MTLTEFVRQLLIDLGPVLDLAGVRDLNEHSWAIVRDIDTTVLAELDESGQFLTLSCELGHPDEELRQSTYETALIATYAAGPEGPLLSLMDREGCLRLSQQLSVGQLSMETLAPVLAAYIQQVDRWRGVLLAGGVVPGEDVSFEFDAAAGIRV